MICNNYSILTGLHSVTCHGMNNEKTYPLNDQTKISWISCRTNTFWCGIFHIKIISKSNPLQFSKRFIHFWIRYMIRYLTLKQTKTGCIKRIRSGISKYLTWNYWICSYNNRKYTISEMKGYRYIDIWKTLSSFYGLERSDVRFFLGKCVFGIGTLKIQCEIGWT